jgi:hypothetical protein
MTTSASRSPHLLQGSQTVELPQTGRSTVVYAEALAAVSSSALAQTCRVVAQHVRVGFLHCIWVQGCDEARPVPS